MNKTTKIMMLISSLVMSQGLMYGSLPGYSPSSEYNAPSEFQPCPTEQYNYSQNVVSQPASAYDMPTEQPIIISDSITTSYFSTAKTRTLVTREVKNGVVITTSQVWTTKNPSYITNANIAITVTVMAAATATGLYVYNYRKFLNVSPERFMAASSAEIMASADVDFTYEGFMQQVKTAGTYSGAEKFIKKHCSTLGSGYGISEKKLIKFDELASDLIQSNKLAIAHNPLSAAKLVEDNAMLQTFKDALRKVDSNFAKEIHDATTFGTNAAAGTAATVWTLGTLFSAIKGRRR